jgi:carbon-monoxide dehydrogenase medium subunit
MIPAAFDYIRPSSVADAVSALASGGENAKVLAGGQSLIPVLRLRLAYPELLVDLGGVDALRGVTDDGDVLTIGAMTTHDAITKDPLIRQHAPLIAQATARSATWARSVAPWRTPIPRATCRRSRSPSTLSWW